MRLERSLPRLALASLGLVLLACQPAEGQGDAELSSRLDRIDERLAAMETQVQAVAEWTAAQTAAKEAADAERKANLDAIAARRAEREAKRAERAAEREALRRSVYGPGGVLDDEDDDELPSSGSRDIEGAAEGIQCSETTPAKIECTVDRAFLDYLLANPALLARQARIVPKSVDGEIQGVKLYGIRRDSLPKRLGLHNGDWVKAIDGKELGTMDEILEVYTALRGAKSFVLELERKGLPLALSIELVE